MNIIQRFSNSAIHCVRSVQSSLATRIPEQLQEFFRPKVVEPVIARATEETYFIRAKRFAENDNSFSRVYPLIDRLSDEERLELAKIAITKFKEVNDTDSCNFVRISLVKFKLKPEGKSQIVEALDIKTKGAVTKSFKAQFGLGREGKSQIGNKLDENTELVKQFLKDQYGIK